MSKNGQKKSLNNQPRLLDADFFRRLPVFFAAVLREPVDFLAVFRVDLRAGARLRLEPELELELDLRAAMVIFGCCPRCAGYGGNSVGSILYGPIRPAFRPM
jgi:hypothetical protein